MFIGKNWYPKLMQKMKIAVIFPSMDCLRFLIDKGANVEVLDNDGLSPLDVAVSEGEYDCALFLIKAGADIRNIKYGVLDDKKLNPATKAALKKTLEQR